MSRLEELSCEFVTTIPDKLAAATLYVSMEYATVVHRCCCGCGNEVVTPLSRTDWKLTYDGEAISLHPSIGNWSFRCRSHYWIRSNRIQWAGPMSDAQVREVRARDFRTKTAHFEELISEPRATIEPSSGKRQSFAAVVRMAVQRLFGRG